MMTSTSNHVPRLSYWKLRCFVLNALQTTIQGRTRFVTVIGKVARRYGTRAFLNNPRNTRNLTDVLSVLLQSKRFRLIDVSAAHFHFRVHLSYSGRLKLQKLKKYSCKMERFNVKKMYAIRV